MGAIMRKLIFTLAILAIATSSFAGGGMTMMVVGSKAPAGASMNTVDMSRGFEIPEASRADDAAWTLSEGAAITNVQDTAQKHAGTYSFSVAGGATTYGGYMYDTGATRTSVSICVWFYAPSSSGGDDGLRVLQFGASSTGTFGAHVLFKKASGVYTFDATGNGTANGTTSITAGAWYRLELTFTQNAAGVLKVYNSAGSLLDTINYTGANNASRYLWTGKVVSSATTSWEALYIDDAGIDWTDATTPLWQYTVAD